MTSSTTRIAVGTQFGDGGDDDDDDDDDDYPFISGTLSKTF